MSNYKSEQRKTQKRYKKKVVGKSIFDDSPTLIVNSYRVPNAYRRAVDDVITAYRSGVPFNRAVDQASTIDPAHINRNKLAEHTLRTIANDC